MMETVIRGANFLEEKIEKKEENLKKDVDREGKEENKIRRKKWKKDCGQERRERKERDKKIEEAKKTKKCAVQCSAVQHSTVTWCTAMHTQERTYCNVTYAHLYSTHTACW